MSSGGTTEKLREEVASLRRQYNMQRVKMSQSIPEMVRYCQDHAQNDPLLMPAKDNPFKDKKRCTLI